MKYLITLLLLLTGLTVTAQNEFLCGVPDRVPPPLPLGLIAKTPPGQICASVFVQVDADIVAVKGLFGAEVFARDAMAQAAIPYQDIDIELSFTFEFLTDEVYANGNSTDLLYQFQDAKPNFPGDVALLLSYKASGGVAFVNTTCKPTNPYRYAFASLRPTHRPYRDGYSWNPMVIAHELGHGFGSPHLQDCAWLVDGNINQSIEGCYQGAGGCPPGPVPTDGGQLMGYCHLNQVGINFSKGFNDQVASLVRANIYNRCTTCDQPDDDGEDPPVVACEGNPLFVDLILDAYPDETSYLVRDADGAIVHQRGPFPRYAPDGSRMTGKVVSDTLCLPDGCYVFEIVDENGLIAEGCGEGLYYVGDPFGEISSGAQFSGAELTRFCLNVDPPANGCTDISPILDDLKPYANQDQRGEARLTGNVLTLTGNTWKAMPYEYTVTPRTVLTGQVNIESIGEIHGIGIVPNVGGLTPTNVLRFGGTQAWGVPVDPVLPGSWQDIEIPVGQLIPSFDYTHIVFVNDYDLPASFGDAVTSFRGLQLCESGAALSEKAARTQVQGTAAEETDQTDNLQRLTTAPYPNPTTDTVILPTPAPWRLYGPTGEFIKQAWGRKVSLRSLPAGVYLLHDGTKAHKIVKR